MITCDVCEEKRQAQKIETPIGNMDLCDGHQKQLREVLELAMSLFRQVKDEAPTDDQCRMWITRMIPTKDGR